MDKFGARIGSLGKEYFLDIECKNTHVGLSTFPYLTPGNCSNLTILGLGFEELKELHQVLKETFEKAIEEGGEENGESKNLQGA